MIPIINNLIMIIIITIISIIIIVIINVKKLILTFKNRAIKYVKRKLNHILIQS